MGFSVRKARKLRNAVKFYSVIHARFVWESVQPSRKLAKLILKKQTFEYYKRQLAAYDRTHDYDLDE